MIRRQYAAPALLGLGLCAAAVAEDSGPKLSPLKAFANWEMTEIESFVPDPASTMSGYPREISNASSVWLLEEAHLSDNARLYAGVGGLYFFILPSKSNQYSIGQRSAFAFTDLHGEFDFWKQDEDHHGLRLKIGVFPFKYNENAKNLGEYMFRTYTYPTIIFTGGLTRVNSAGVQLNGIDANTKLGGFDNDLLVTVKTDQTPSAALSLTEILSYSLGGGIFKVGAGWQLDNFYDPSKIGTGKYDVQQYNYYYKLADGTYKAKKGQGSMAEFVPGTDVAVDSGRLSFTGQKAMFQATLDIGKAINSPILSEKDLRLYFEAIVLGLENRPLYYQKRADRTAYAFGFNFPTFRLLDVLAAEAEYCSNPYPNDAGNATLNLSPTPLPASFGKVKRDNVKWTVYASKTLVPGFSVTGQVANDHMRLVDYFGHTNDRDVMPEGKNWYWSLALGYAI